MAVKRKPWEDVVSFDDWKQEVNDDSQEEEPGKSYAEGSAPQEIQGIGINTDDEDIDLNDMIASLNQQNAGYVEKAREEEKEQREKVLEAEREAERKRQEEILRAKFEAESAERERIAFEEAEAYAAAEREKREKSFKAVTSKLFKKKPKDDETDIASPIESEEKEIDNDPSVEETIPTSHETILDNSGNNKSDDVDSNLSEPELNSGVEIENNSQEESRKESDSTLLSMPKRSEHQNVTKVKNREKILEKKRIEKEMQRMEEAQKENDAVPEENVEISVSTPESVTHKEEEKEPIAEEDLLLSGNTEELNVSQSESPSDEETKSSSTKKETKKETKNSKEIQKEKAPKPEKPVKEQKEKKPFFLFGKKQKALDQQSENYIEKSSGTTKENDRPDWEFLATHDEMTGLLNQRAYEEQKGNAHKKPYAVIFVDVNNLKYANDTLGHAAGNKLIIATADKLKELFPNCVYRIGGDEFVAVVEYASVKKIEKDLVDKKNNFNESLLAKTKEEKESGLIYAASFGYAYTDGSKSFDVVSAEADKAMYAVKEAYKKANPQFDMRSGKGKLPDKNKKEEPPKDYDSLLTDEQRNLKSTIKNNHRPVSAQSTAQILRDVQSRASEVIAILIADPNFNQLFIILKPDVFINIVTEMEAMIDYSYLYILYEGGPQYKGSDEYLSEVTHIFEAIGNGIKSGRIRSEKDFQKIKGINVFKNIYIDM